MGSIRPESGHILASKGGILNGAVIHALDTVDISPLSDCFVAPTHADEQVAAVFVEEVVSVRAVGGIHEGFGADDVGELDSCFVPLGDLV